MARHPFTPERVLMGIAALCIAFVLVRCAMPPA